MELLQILPEIQEFTQIGSVHPEPSERRDYSVCTRGSVSCTIILLLSQTCLQENIGGLQIPAPSSFTSCWIRTLRLSEWSVSVGFWDRSYIDRTSQPNLRWECIRFYTVLSGLKPTMIKILILLWMHFTLKLVLYVHKMNYVCFSWSELCSQPGSSRCIQAA